MLLVPFGLCLLSGSTTSLLSPQISSLFLSLAHLLLVFPLGVEASLDAFPGLLKGLPLGALSRIVGAYSHDVGTGEDQHVGHYLWKTVREKQLEHKECHPKTQTVQGSPKLIDLHILFI